MKTPGMIAPFETDMFSNKWIRVIRVIKSLIHSKSDHFMHSWVRQEVNAKNNKFVDDSLGSVTAADIQ